MTHETGKAAIRRSQDARFKTRYFVGAGIDIGAGDDTLDNYRHLFPCITSMISWDLQDGDAMLMRGAPDNTFDFVNSSHCLEHLIDPHIALLNWIRICKPAGHLVIVVPDEDLYEQRQWPSRFNPDHKHSFTISKPASWSPASLNVLNLVEKVDNLVRPLKIELLDAGYIYGLTQQDQSLNATCEPAIEIVLQKVTNPA